MYFNNNVKNVCAWQAERQSYDQEFLPCYELTAHQQTHHNRRIVFSLRFGIL